MMVCPECGARISSWYMVDHLKERHKMGWMEAARMRLGLKDE